MSNKPAAPAKRRNFLKLAVVGGGSFAVTGAARAHLAQPETEAASPKDEEPKGKGYRETEHIRRYYDKARF